MRILGTNAPAMVANAAQTRRGSGSGFAVPDDTAPRQAGQAASLRTVGGIDALIALQGQDEPGERRRRAVKRGRIALDALDELKIGVLAGTIETSMLQRLKAATAELRDSTGDSGLDAVLGEIELRLEVEIAKMSPRNGSI